MAVVEGPFRYVVGVDGSEGVCGMPVSYPAPPADFFVRFLFPDSPSTDLSLFVALRTVVDGLTLRAEGQEQYRSIYGVRYGSGRWKTGDVEEYVRNDCFGLGTLRFQPLPSGNQLSRRSIDARALQTLGVASDYGTVFGRGGPPASGDEVYAVTRGLLGRSDADQLQEMARLIKPGGSSYLLASRASYSDPWVEHMSMKDALLLEAERVEVEIANGVTLSGGNLETAIEQESSEVRVRLLNRGEILATIPDVQQLISRIIRKPTLTGAGFFRVNIRRWSLSPGRIDLVYFQVDGPVCAATPLAGVHSESVGSVLTHAEPGFRWDRYSGSVGSYYLNCPLDLGSAQPRRWLTQVKVRVSMARVSVIGTWDTGDEQEVAWLSYSHRRLRLVFQDVNEQAIPVTDAPHYSLNFGEHSFTSRGSSDREKRYGRFFDLNLA